MITVTKQGTNLRLSFPWDEILVIRARCIPQRRFEPNSKTWSFKPMTKNIEYVKKNFPDAEWDDASEVEAKRAMGFKERRLETLKEKETLSELDFDKIFENIPFRMTPFNHQREALYLGRDKDVFGYLMDQGTGKTKTLLDDAAHNYRKGKIDALLIISPNGVKTGWVDNSDDDDEVTKHMAPDIPYVKGTWFSSQTKAQQKELANVVKPGPELKIIAVNVESIRTRKTFAFLKDFVQRFRTMIVVDESTRIKHMRSARTKAAIELRQHCPLARIMTGTMTIKSPLDAFAQLWFLNPEILGFATMTAFKARHAVMGGYQNKQVLSFLNLDEISDAISSVSYRVLKRDCLDLPKSTYIKRKLMMSTEQKRAYQELREESILFLKEFSDKHDGVVLAENVLARITRLQQVTSGFLPVIDQETGETTDIIPIGKTNPKIEEAMEISGDSGGKVVIWCRFKWEVKNIIERLTDKGFKCVRFDGTVKEKDRIIARKSFRDDPSVTHFVGTAGSGGIGINELVVADTVIYMSNSFDTEQRVQSWDRTDRIGVLYPVTYYDLTFIGTVDTKILAVIRSNQRISDAVMKDGWDEWI